MPACVHYLRIFFATLVFSISLLLSSTTARCEDSPGIETTSGVFRMTFENVSISGEKDMGFLGGTFLYDVKDWFAIGPGVYGAATGNRGGFITLGMAGELKKNITDRLSITGGLFVGAGGGGGGGEELSGNGLMIRPHAGLTLRLGKRNYIGTGVSHITFPDGSIRSTQLYVSYEHAFDVLIHGGWLKRTFSKVTSKPSVPALEQEFGAVYRQYFVPDSVKTSDQKSQHDSIGLMGVEWTGYLNDNVFLKSEIEGAMQGESNGYMQILLGGGYRFPLTDRTFLKLAAQIGVAGGGAVDTGGGFLVNGEVLLQQYIADHLYLSASGGYVNAPDGSFKAATASLQLGYRYGTPHVYKGIYPLSALDDYDRHHFRIRTTHQTYLKSDNDNWRTDHSDLDVDNLGFQLDYFATEWIYLTGQGLAAYGRGKAGAYMAGLVGAGVHCPLMNTPFFLDLEGLAGAAGGGGLAVGGGLVWQVNAGVGYMLGESFSIIATIGHIDAPRGDFEAHVVGVSVGYNFTTFGK